MATSNNSITVRYGALSEPLVVKRIAQGTTITQFCEKNGITYDSALRVNGATVNREQLLRENDVITAISRVSGGRF